MKEYYLNRRPMLQDCQRSYQSRLNLSSKLDCLSFVAIRQILLDSVSLHERVSERKKFILTKINQAYRLAAGTKSEEKQKILREMARARSKVAEEVEAISKDEAQRIAANIAKLPRAKRSEVWVYDHCLHHHVHDQTEQETHVAAVGSAFRRFGSIGPPHLTQVPYVPSDIRFRVASIWWISVTSVFSITSSAS